ncbi:MAG: hypothetical protein KIT22_07055 [Verrucomicrobiae bacterium]|nr:hypothetical protein [Verrucomicrobiae bacterium]
MDTRPVSKVIPPKFYVRATAEIYRQTGRLDAAKFFERGASDLIERQRQASPNPEAIDRAAAQLRANPDSEEARQQAEAAFVPLQLDNDLKHLLETLLQKLQDQPSVAELLRELREGLGPQWKIHATQVTIGDIHTQINRF